MSSKLGLILSMIFVTMFFAFGIDLIAIQFIYSDLDAKATSISYRLSKYGNVDSEITDFIEAHYNVKFECLDNCYPVFGDVVLYRISKDYHPIIIQNDTLTVSIKRSAVMGYHN